MYMFQNGQTHFKNVAANGARSLKYVWPLWDIMHYWVNQFVVRFTYSIATGRILFAHLSNNSKSFMKVTAGIFF